LNAKQQTTRGKDRVGVIDVIAHDTKTGEVVLVMNEPDKWDGSDARLLALQERLNAYVSFLLDGEMVSEHPDRVVRHDSRSARVPGNKNGGYRERSTTHGARLRRVDELILRLRKTSLRRG